MFEGRPIRDSSYNKPINYSLAKVFSIELVTHSGILADIPLLSSLANSA